MALSRPPPIYDGAVTHRAWLVGLLVSLAIAAGCGGGGRRGGDGSSSRARPPAGPPDIPAMRALLDRYAPTASHILRDLEVLPTRFVIGRTTSTLSFDKGFADYIDDDSIAERVSYLSTAVHESYHAYAPRLGYHLLVRSGATELGLGAEGLYVGGEPLLVHFSPTYPSAEMDATFPADARTFRYPTYVSPSQPPQSTQQDGVFGLLDEMTAYFHSARTHLDLWPWVRDEAPADEDLLENYVTRLHSIWQAYAEFRLYIAHYLLHARDHRPDVYRALLANDSFRRAFTACDDAWAALLAEAAALEPTVHAFARERGVEADLVDGRLVMYGTPSRIREPGYDALVRHLASERYQQVLAELR